MRWFVTQEVAAALSQPPQKNVFRSENTLGTQIFFYRAHEPNDDYSRHGIGLQHLAFGVSTRAVVEQAYQWAVGCGAEVVHQPRRFPEYGEHTYATYFLDPFGIMLEVVCQAPDDPTRSGERPL